MEFGCLQDKTNTAQVKTFARRARTSKEPSSVVQPHAQTLAVVSDKEQATPAYNDNWRDADLSAATRELASTGSCAAGYESVSPAPSTEPSTCSTVQHAQHHAYAWAQLRQRRSSVLLPAFSGLPSQAGSGLLGLVAQHAAAHKRGAGQQRVTIIQGIIQQLQDYYAEVDAFELVEESPEKRGQGSKTQPKSKRQGMPKQGRIRFSSLAPIQGSPAAADDDTASCDGIAASSHALGHPARIPQEGMQNPQNDTDAGGLDVQNRDQDVLHHEQGREAREAVEVGISSQASVAALKAPLAAEQGNNQAVVGRMGRATGRRKTTAGIPAATGKGTGAEQGPCGVGSTGSIARLSLPAQAAHIRLPSCVEETAASSPDNDTQPASADRAGSGQAYTTSPVVDGVQSLSLGSDSSLISTAAARRTSSESARGGGEVVNSRQQGRRSERRSAAGEVRVRDSRRLLTPCHEEEEQQDKATGQEHDPQPYSLSEVPAELGQVPDTGINNATGSIAGMVADAGTGSCGICQPDERVLQPLDSLLASDSEDDLPTVAEDVANEIPAATVHDTAATQQQQRRTELQQLLRICGQNVAESNIPCMEQFLEQLLEEGSQPLNKVSKVGEGSYGEAYKHGRTVFKVIPIHGEQVVNDCAQKQAGEVMAEALMALQLTSLRQNTLPGSHQPSANMTKGFVETRKVGVCRAPYAPSLVRAWHKWDKQHQSENDPVDTLADPEQLFLVLAMSDCGRDLEKVTIPTFDAARAVLTQVCGAMSDLMRFCKNATMTASRVLAQVAFTLAAAECHCQFEHRDLHWGNILLCTTVTGWVDCRVRGVQLQLATMGSQVSLIDFTASRLCTPEGMTVYCDLSQDEGLFQGPRHNVQFDTYRWMRQLTGDDWASPCFGTNCLWMAYLAEVIVAHKANGYTSSQKRAIREFRKRALQADSCTDLLDDALFDGMWRQGPACV